MSFRFTQEQVEKLKDHLRQGCSGRKESAEWRQRISTEMGVEASKIKVNDYSIY